MNDLNIFEIPEIVDGLPNFCGLESQVEEVTRERHPVFLPKTNLKLDRLQSVFSIALHMHQPLIPVGGEDLGTADLISNLDFMMRHPNMGDNHNAGVFAECYARMSELVSDLVTEGFNPRVMLDYSGELLFGLRKMGRGDLIERLRCVTCDSNFKQHVEWLGTMWGHAVASSSPPPDFALHIRAWQQNFAAIFGWEALSRVRGFSPPEMHLPNHPDVAFEFVKALKECGYRWLLVQEHTVETSQGKPLNQKHQPFQLKAKNSCGDEASIIAFVKTQGSDTKLIGQMQPYYEALTLKHIQIGGISIPPIVTQIGDGENGGVMMNEFPSAYRQAVSRFKTDGTVNVNVTEYLEMIEDAGVTESAMEAIQPIHQGTVFSRIESSKSWGPGAADKAIADLKQEHPGFSMDGGSWTNSISWVKNYENVLTPMNKLSVMFHEMLDGKSIDKKGVAYRSALLYLLTSQTSCFRYWGQGLWTDYAREICRRGTEALRHL